MLEDWFFSLNSLKHKGLIKGRLKGYDMKVPYNNVLNHFKEEWKEFIEAYESNNVFKAMKEIADLSNMCDLFYEQLYVLAHTNKHNLPYTDGQLKKYMKLRKESVFKL